LPLIAPNPGSLAPDLPAEVYRLGLSASAEREAVPAGAQLCPAPCDDLDDLNWLSETRAQHPDSAIYGPPLWGQPQFLALAGPAAEGTYFLTAAPYPVDSADPAFTERYTTISNGVTPRSNAVLAYDATRLLIAALADSADEQVTPNRAGVQAALAETSIDGLSGHIAFDAGRAWATAGAWVYQWQGDEAVLVHSP
jgi:ABC-type branched-subunit amino acid transport system substrate-binding protein